MNMTDDTIDSFKPYMLLTPAAKAYALAYLSSTSPRLLSITFSYYRRDCTPSDAVANLRRVFRQALGPNRFPAFCGTLIGLFTVLQKPLFDSLTQATQLLYGERSKLGAKALRRLSRFLAALIAALCSFSLLNKTSPSTSSTRANELEDGATSQTTSSNDGRKRKRESKIPSDLPPLPPAAILNREAFYPQGIPLAGKTIDLTLFAVVRAADAIVQWRRKRHPARSRTARIADSLAAPLLFAASSATIMHAFFYKPGRLPYGYVRWIERIAGVDARIIAALRHAYYGNFVYGKETGMAPLLGSLAQELGIPEELGDPAKTIPVSCDLVHQRAGLSCEAHALRRFWSGWCQAMELYGPLQALLLLRTARRRKAEWRRGAFAAFREAARSSAFLGTFIALFYVGVCGARTRVGARVVPRSVVSAQAYDSGLAIAVGCLLCGWSVLLEPPRRRTELMLFVVPRAVAVWFPRRYPKQFQWRERVAFVLSAAVVLTAVQERPDTVRGVFGRLLGRILAP